MSKYLLYKLGCICILFLPVQKTDAQQSNEKLWHNIQREIHYQPEGEDFVLVNGKGRFNRALYGSGTAFRAEAGDLPEFALYMPGMGGNLKFGLIVNDSSKWLIDSRHIKARYRPGSMIYEIQDPLLSNGSLTVTAIPLFVGEGLIVKIESKGVPANVKLFAAYGGATGTKFSRDGDIGADPESSFYLKPEYCRDNIFTISKDNSFTLHYGLRRPLTEEERYEIQHRQTQPVDTARIVPGLKVLKGLFPITAQLKLSDAREQGSPLQFYNSKESTAPALTAQMALTNGGPLYFYLNNNGAEVPYAEVGEIFNKAEEARQQLAGRIKINTPDPFINTLGGALSVASDAVWDDHSFMHGAVAWRMRLNGWRGAYTADLLGWSDRARKHFNGYALSQLTTPLKAPVVMDTALNLARHAEVLGTAVFSSGYISRNPGGDKRAHHYDMNLVFIDQLLSHFLWTGDTAYVKQMWPLLTRHLDWEKRNFDMDGDGLYDSYAAIWASDALQYSGGGVTHSSAYNYRSNKIAALLASIIGENSEPYKKEADKILKAIDSKLWMPSIGSYAEFKDLLGLKKVHPSAGLWTIYHTLDSYVPNRFQAYQSLRYIDTEIPHIPIRAKGLADTTLYTLSTTNWHPYTWSLNNVALAELLHTALAYWQGGRREEAYKLWKSSLVESMYLGASPGNIQQLSFYDAIRGELYRDFADPIGMASRTLVEGLFGIWPNALQDTLHLTPGFPADWDHASISTPYIDFAFKKDGNTDTYKVTTRFNKKLKLLLKAAARMDDIESVMVNGRKAIWTTDNNAIEVPVLNVFAADNDAFEIEIRWKGKPFEGLAYEQTYAKGQPITLSSRQAVINTVYDPQKVLSSVKTGPKTLKAIIAVDEKNKSFFVKATQGRFSYWIPVNFSAKPPVEIVTESDSLNVKFCIKNNTAATIAGKVVVNNNYSVPVNLASGSCSNNIAVPSNHLVAGTNSIHFVSATNNASATVTNWNISSTASSFDKIDLSPFYNEAVTNIFKNRYLSPRPTGPTLQLPTQGIGNWAYPLTTANISDSGLRIRAGSKNEIVISQGVPFSTPSAFGQKNILFTSQWDNYPDSINIPLKGKASHAYFMMAGSTNPMQSRFTNGEVIIKYKDGSTSKLELINPETWWPIEQDYYEDDYAFKISQPKPVRVYLKTGIDTRNFNKFTTIKGFANRGIDGGAATVLDLPLNNSKELQSITLKTLANDVVIGLMSLTLVR